MSLKPYVFTVKPYINSDKFSRRPKRTVRPIPFNLANEKCLAYVSTVYDILLNTNLVHEQVFHGFNRTLIHNNRWLPALSRFLHERFGTSSLRRNLM